MSHNGLSVYDAKAKIREYHRKSLSGEPVTCNTTSMFLPVTADETASGNNNNTSTEESHGKKERPHTNNGAKRKVYYDIETVIKDVYPDDPAFDSQMASHIGFDEVVRYELVPMKFRKVIYRVHKYSQRGVLMEGKTPMAPFLNSNYDGSFIAGISHLRFMYSMPVERIVKYFGENGFDMPKQTAHGLLAKTENLFEKLNEALKMTVKTDSYGCADETYHKILVKEKNKDGKGIKNGYIWGFLAVNLGLVYFFYCRGSRGRMYFSNSYAGLREPSSQTATGHTRARGNGSSDLHVSNM